MIYATGDGFDMLKDCPVLGYLGTLDEIWAYIAELGTITLESSVRGGFPQETPEATEVELEATESEAEDAPAIARDGDEAEPEGEAEVESTPAPSQLHKQFDIAAAQRAAALGYNNRYRGRAHDDVKARCRTGSPRRRSMRHGAGWRAVCPHICRSCRMATGHRALLQVAQRILSACCRGLMRRRCCRRYDALIPRRLCRWCRWPYQLNCFMAPRRRLRM